ncbi:unnamed protein product [Bursaphelenchus okinawaensis]|uniref:FIP-RBD domain-containing protein n=1 Tax=Bursaphelenchus okinawaensis TaxID=465554 RepID=A0A811K5V5_9BILA|nr:unnamed protein product [Bursaphelenchus okinawaensis]CAG9092084.1 unnamed protein product [Bursaphelenchus okinawaensis]
MSRLRQERIRNAFQASSSMGLEAGAASSTAVASRLFARSRKNSYSSEPELIQMDGSSSDPSDPVGSMALEMTDLSKRLHECQEEKNQLSLERTRLRAENNSLQEQIHSLEYQHATAVANLEERLESERQRAKEGVQRVEREKQLELESINYKQQVLERDLENARKECQRLQDEYDDIRHKYDVQQNEMDDIKNLNSELEKEKKLLRSQFETYRREAEDELQEQQDRLDQLSQETDELRGMRNGTRQRHGSVDLIQELELRCESLKQDNKELRENVEELKGQLLTQSVQSGQMLLANGPSLAAELSGMDSDEVGWASRCSACSDHQVKKQELMKALHEQELCNQQLRKYIDNILLRVVELYPEILEIASSSCHQNEANKPGPNTSRSASEANSSVFGSLRAALAYASFRRPQKPPTSPTFTSEQWTTIPEEPRSRSVDGEHNTSFGAKLYSYLPSSRLFRRSTKPEDIKMEEKDENPVTADENRPSPPPPDPIIERS